jgi:hypothetical protein
MKYYRIVCLKRSNFNDKSKYEFLSDWYVSCDLVYWKDNYSGYTRNQEEAGLYSLQELDDVNGRFMDYYIEPAWV